MRVSARPSKSLYHTNGTKIGGHRVVDPKKDIKKIHASKAREKARNAGNRSLDLFSLPRLQASNTPSMKNHHTTEMNRKNTLERNQKDGN